ncbi:hypothetical protein AX16_002700 [Volvariella volvacea WC 439]|nr:hypothetical protein AX16_002700 [Volvariella volvacea WC 439]
MASQHRGEEQEVTGEYTAEQRPPPTVENPYQSNAIAPEVSVEWALSLAFGIASPLGPHLLGVTRHVLPQRVVRALIYAISSTTNCFKIISITRVLVRYTYPPLVQLYRIFYMMTPAYLIISSAWVLPYITAMLIFTTSEIYALPSTSKKPHLTAFRQLTTNGTGTLKGLMYRSEKNTKQLGLYRLLMKPSPLKRKPLGIMMPTASTSHSGSTPWLYPIAFDATVSHNRRATRASIFYDRFKARSALSDLDEAISEMRPLVVSAHDPISLAHQLMRLGVFLSDRYRHQRRVEDLDESIECIRKAIGKAPEGHSILSLAYHNLSIVVRERYLLLNRDEDLEEALNHSKQAVESIPPTDKRRCYIYHQLGSTLLLQYKENSVLQILELALKWLDEALSAADPTDRNNFRIQMDLAEAHRNLFLKQGNSEDLELAFMWITMALATPSLQNRDLAQLHHFLGLIHRERWLRFRHVEDLDPAINAKLLAVQYTPTPDPELYNRQASLGLSYSDRHKKSGSLDDQAQALEWFHRAIETAPAGHPSLPTSLSRLSYEYSTRYVWRRDEEDLVKAITYALRAIELMPKGEHYPELYSALASCYSQKADLNHDNESVENAYSWFRKYMETNPPPEGAWKQANEWARFADRHKHKEECIAAYTRVMRILPELLWIGSKITVRHEKLKRHDIASVTPEVIESCIRFNALEKAVEFVEQGLAITFQQLLDLRDDHVDLYRAHPELADELKGLSYTLERISSDTGTQPNNQEIPENRSLEAQRRRTADQRERLLHEIRALPGFENFLLPKPFEKLREAASEGPVVILHNTRTRGHALVLTQSGVEAVPLRNTSYAVVMEQLNKLRDSLLRLGIHTRARRDPDSWDGITGGRIWWCPTGPFTYLPIHAAGPPNNFVHSYTSTLGGLIRARKAQAEGNSKPNLTAIGLSEFAETTISHLPSVLEELSRVQGVARAANIDDESLVMLVNQEATLETVTQAIGKSSWLHLACHGQQNANDPLKSGLLLYDDKLELQKLMEMPLPDAQFIFLSACETAMGDRNMTNESLHLAGGMLFAGFKGAVGTLWSINDADGPFVAENVYYQLLATGEKPDVRNAAKALHNAIHSLRQNGAPAYRWVPFIHLGI